MEVIDIEQAQRLIESAVARCRGSTTPSQGDITGDGATALHYCLVSAGVLLEAARRLAADGAQNPLADAKAAASCDALVQMGIQAASHATLALAGQDPILPWLPLMAMGQTKSSRQTVGIPASRVRTIAS